MPSEPRPHFDSRAGIASLLVVLAMMSGCGGSPHSSVPGTAYWSVAAADLDGDGLMDIAGSYAGGGSPPHRGYVAVLLQDRAMAGHFLPAQVYPVGNDPFALTAGDFNGDARIDLATDNEILATSGAGLDDISVLLQSPAAAGQFLPAISCSGVYGDGSPAPEDPLCPTLSLPGSFSVNTVRTDLNGDGLADQAIAYEGRIRCDSEFDCYFVDTYIEVILQDAAAPGTYLPAERYRAVDGGFVTWVVAADINGDARPDLVFSQSNGLYIRHQDAGHPGQFLGAVLVTR